MLERIADAVKRAGDIILSSRDGGKVYAKEGSANFVTEYDLRVQAFLQKELLSIAPEADFVGEESEKGSERRVGRLRFIVDPIDGTTNFMHDARHSCVSVALCEGDSPLCGAVYNPYLGELFLSERGKGAFLGEKRLRVSRRKAEEAVFSFGTTPYDKARLRKTFDYAAALYAGFADLRRSGSAALDLCYVAAGRSEGFFELSLSPWDYAAGMLIVTEAGGTVSTFDGSPLTLDKPCPVLAGTDETYSVMLEKAKAFLPF